MKNEYEGTLYIIGAVFGWGLADVVVKHLFSYTDPIPIFAIRAILTTVVLTFIFHKKYNFKIFSKIKENISMFTVCGVLGLTFCWIFFSMGFKLATVASTILSLQLHVIVAVLLAFIFLGERLSRKEVLGMIVALFGLSIVSWNGLPIDELLNSDYFIGNILAAIAAVCWGVYVFSNKKLQEKFQPVEVVYGSFIFAAILLPVASVLLGQHPQSSLFTDPLNLTLVLLLGSAGTIVPFYLYTEGLKRLKVSVASIIGSLQPVASGGLAALFLGEAITAYQILGGLLILLGVNVIILTKPEK